MTRLILFHKPYLVLCQFTDSDSRASLADFGIAPGLYPAGRLDHDSEGLVVLTDCGRLQHLITDPRHKLPKLYWAQVERVPEPPALRKLATGIELRDGRTRPAIVELIEPPPASARTPPIRARKNIPTAWLAIALAEGRNRQVRRMTAAVGHPTLRLIRAAIGPWRLESLAPGEWRQVPCPASPDELRRLVQAATDSDVGG